MGRNSVFCSLRPQADMVAMAVRTLYSTGSHFGKVCVTARDHPVSQGLAASPVFKAGWVPPQDARIWGQKAFRP